MSFAARWIVLSVVLIATQRTIVDVGFVVWCLSRSASTMNEQGTKIGNKYVHKEKA